MMPSASAAIPIRSAVKPALAEAPPPPEGAIVPLQASEPEVILPRSHTVIEHNDHVVFFLPNKRLVREVEKLFRVSATFF